MKMSTGAALLALCMCLAAMPCGAVFGEEGCPLALDQESGVFAKMKRVRREINLHNLYNGLHMTVDQMERILALALKARVLREECFGPGNARAEQIAESYSRILSVVRAGERIPRNLEGMGVLMEFAEKRLKKRYFRGVEALEAELWSVLTPAQRDIFKGYEPCLIPPKNLKDPVRVGQGSSDEEGHQLLALARRLPEKDFEKECAGLVSLHLSVLEKFLGKMEPPDRRAEIERMVSVCRRARPLSDVDFALKAGVLARELSLDAPKDRFKAKAEEFLALVRRYQGGSIGAVANHFLDPMVIPVLKARIERAKNATQAPPKDLKEVEGARPPGTKCGLEPGEETPGIKKKYTVGELTEILGLDASTKSRFLEIVRKAKAAQLKMMQIPMMDGKTPLTHFLEIQKLPPAQREAAGHDLLLRMQEPIPGRDASHFEYIVRIQMSMDVQFREILDPERYGKLESLVEDFLEQIEPEGEKKKPRLAELAGQLGMGPEQTRAVAEVLRRKQGETFQILSIPDGRGKKPLETILALQVLPEEKRAEAFASFLYALEQRIPGRDTTYMAELERIKSEIMEAFRKQLSPEKYRELESMGIDVLDIQVE